MEAIHVCHTVLLYIPNVLKLESSQRVWIPDHCTSALVLMSWVSTHFRDHFFKVNTK